MTTYSNLKYDHAFSSNATGTGSLTLISSQTASASSSISFTSGIDSTYDEYVFKIINCHPSVNNSLFSFNFSSDNGSNYNVVKTSTYFSTYHYESDASATLVDESSYTGFGCAQYSGYQYFGENVGANNNDECISGYLHLFQPSSSTYVKHFIGANDYIYNAGSSYDMTNYLAGYGNTTSAINAVDFKFSSGTITGTIKMYGIA